MGAGAWHGMYSRAPKVACQVACRASFILHAFIQGFSMVSSTLCCLGPMPHALMRGPCLHAAPLCTTMPLPFCCTCCTNCCPLWEFGQSRSTPCMCPAHHMLPHAGLHTLHPRQLPCPFHLLISALTHTFPTMCPTERLLPLLQARLGRLSHNGRVPVPQSRLLCLCFRCNRPQHLPQPLCLFPKQHLPVTKDCQLQGLIL